MQLNLLGYSLDITLQHVAVYLVASLIASLPLFIFGFLEAFSHNETYVQIMDAFMVAFPAIMAILIFFASKKMNCDFKDKDLAAITAISSAITLVAKSIALLLQLLMMSILLPSAGPDLKTEFYNALPAIQGIAAIPFNAFAMFMLLYLAFNFDRRKITPLILPSAGFYFASVLGMLVFKAILTMPGADIYTLITMQTWEFLYSFKMFLYFLATLFFIKQGIHKDALSKAWKVAALSTLLSVATGGLSIPFFAMILILAISLYAILEWKEMKF